MGHVGISPDNYNLQQYVQQFILLFNLVAQGQLSG
jgi:hypothetical protein